MPTEVEWALLKAKVEQTDAELRELREETIVSLQAKTDKLCKDFSTVKNIAVGRDNTEPCQQLCSYRFVEGFVMSGKILLLILILVAGIAGQQYRAVKGHPVITLIEGDKNDCSQR